MAGGADEAADRRLMRRALALARRGRGWTDPNPMVGCVLVRDGRIVGEGYHARVGGAHAEAAALERAGDAAAGATAYVTLEPCSHQGRTPPCADRLVEAGVARVEAAMADPDERVSGRGLERLRKAGVEVNTGALGDTAEALNAGFVKRARTGWPWVTLKLAASLDGRTATSSGESQWITSEAARTDVHRLRHGHAAIITGSGTVMADDPSLTARIPEGGAHPLRVVLDSELRTVPGARVVTGPGRCLVVAGHQASAERRQALEAAGTEVMAVPADGDGRLNLAAVWDELGRREINSVLAECGATLAGSMLFGGWVDRLVTYQAPTIIGAGGRAMFAVEAITSMAERIELDVLERREIGPDWRITAKPSVQC
ncbi:bifunctional diaminohydroxyphosphoribosylaminopyrimidine deaminase/5-amino-6-(5-phosphoribosylamino)uracil reductase RibD [Thiohalorhabdus sp.]|uniref:bifunctional diaminohydroxyphosphoribosylaminopyrimidine deaminase/5-amino-6-(5-phosphoribosylamino)uracil reductase RibD n=1 Tax=Thiohalorhabdus sp. TaxID=3094134 RepID=UPI002FC368E4